MDSVDSRQTAGGSVSPSSDMSKIGISVTALIFRVYSVNDSTNPKL